MTKKPVSNTMNDGDTEVAPLDQKDGDWSTLKWIVLTVIFIPILIVLNSNQYLSMMALAIFGGPIVAVACARRPKGSIPKLSTFMIAGFSMPILLALSEKTGILALISIFTVTLPVVVTGLIVTSSRTVKQSRTQMTDRT